MPADVVLVHGAWHGAWCWQRVLAGLAQRGVSAHAIDLPGHGQSTEPLGDLALRRIDAPRRAFVRDKVPVVVEIDRFGSAVRDLGGVVRLVDDLSGGTLDRVELLPGDDRDRVTLTAEPELAGEATWSVVIDMTEPDLVPENNRRPPTTTRTARATSASAAAKGRPAV